MQTKLIRLFLISAGVLLFATAMAKLVSSFGGDVVLEKNDPLFGISYRNIFRVFGALESAIALTCLLAKRIFLRAGLIAWLATNFVIYRASMPLVGYVKPCPCLGSLTTAIHVSPQIADNVMKVILAYLLIGSYTSLFWLWRQHRTEKKDGRQNEEVKSESGVGG